MSYPGHSLGDLYISTEMQSVYSIAIVDWETAQVVWNMFNLKYKDYQAPIENLTHFPGEEVGNCFLNSIEFIKNSLTLLADANVYFPLFSEKISERKKCFFFFFFSFYTQIT